MDEKTIKRKGGFNAILFIALGLFFSFLFIIASAHLYSPFALLFFFAPETEVDQYFIIALLALTFIGYFLGCKAAIEIVIKKRNKYLISYLYGLMAVLLAAFIYSSVRVISQVSPIHFDDNLLLDFYRPICLALLFGFPSLLLFGFLFAKQISRIKTHIQQ